MPEQIGSCVLWLAGVSWDSLPGTDRRLVEEIDQPIIWVDSYRSPLRPKERWLPVRAAEMQVMRHDPVLVRVTPGSLPFSTRWGIREVRAPLKRRQLRAALNALGAKPHTVVLSYLDDLFGAWGDEAIEVLLGTDDYVAGAGLMRLSAAWLARQEEMALKKADVVLTVSEGLAARWRELGASPVLFPNGCTPVPEEYLYDHKNKNSANGRDSSPIVGLVGHLSSRIDITVLEEISDSGCRLLLIGPKDPRWEPERFADLTRRESVEYLGRVSPESIPSYLLQVDVGITPYHDSDFNRASFPLKTLEYLGAGLPVVTSNLPAARWLRNDIANCLGEDAVERHLELANTARDFVSGVETLARWRSTEWDRERWRFASTHSWSSRAATLESIVEHARNARAQNSIQSTSDFDEP